MKLGNIINVSGTATLIYIIIIILIFILWLSALFSVLKIREFLYDMRELQKTQTLLINDIDNIMRKFDKEYSKSKEENTDSKEYETEL